MSNRTATTQEVHDFGINGSSDDSDRLKRIQSLEPEQFEKLFLAPQNRVAGELQESCHQLRIVEERLTRPPRSIAEDLCQSNSRGIGRLPAMRFDRHN